MISGELHGGWGILLLGLTIGMQHALEADHVAAVSSIAARQTSVRRIVTHGAVWGLGHTITLMSVAAVAMVLGATVNETFATWLELLVGVMLVGLGGHVVVALVRERIHFHRHRHDDGTAHFHAHSHRGQDLNHDPRRHDHSHPRGLPIRSLPIRSLLVGMMHGMAGSAALLVLTATTARSVPLGMGYVTLFGIGSILGMTVLSAVVAVPLTWTSRALTWANQGLQSTIGFATMALGGVLVGDNLRVLAGG